MDKRKPASRYKPQTGPRRGLLKAAAASSLALMMLVTGAGVASANYGPGGMGFKGSRSSPLNLQPVGVDSYWYGVIDEGARRWNQSEAYANLYRLRSGSSAGRIYADYYEWPEYGWYRPYYQKCVNRGFNIEINARTIARDNPSSRHDFVNKGVMMHEMGHILSLGDSPTQASAMGGTSDYPTRYDVDLVNRYNRVSPCQKGEWN